MTTTLPIPFRCIWCRKTEPDVSFKSESHVLPASVGNVDQVLPPGVVCDTCNWNFKKIEREIISDLRFQVQAWAFRLGNPRTGRASVDLVTDQGPLPDPEGSLHFKFNSTSLNTLEVVIITAVGKWTRTEKYAPRRFAFLSRSKHKIAFESLAWGVYIHGVDEDLLRDPLDPAYDYVRAWVKEGVPQQQVRSFFRPRSFSLTVSLPSGFEPTFYSAGPLLFCEYNEGADWFAVDLTSPPDAVLHNLGAWAQRRGLEEVFWIGDGFKVVGLRPPPDTSILDFRSPG